eukprot:6875462-Pyramimonas_sp.AAC.1
MDVVFQNESVAGVEAGQHGPPQNRQEREMFQQRLQRTARAAPALEQPRDGLPGPRPPPCPTRGSASAARRSPRRAPPWPQR